MKMNKPKRLLVLLLAAAIIIGIAAVSALAGTSDPTVTFDVQAQTFSFQNIERYSDASGSRTYFDLFRDIKNAMPGDSFKQNITVAVSNIGGNTVNMRLRSENANKDYEELMKGAALSVYDGSNTISGSLDEGVSLGAFTNGNESRNLDVELTIPITAGNELKGLTAQCDWVFVAEIIPPYSGNDDDDDDEIEIPDDPIPGSLPQLDRVNHYAYIIGRDDGLVHPEAYITRSEVATIFFRMLTEKSRADFWSKTNSYHDVISGAWYNTAVSTLSGAGVIKGYPNGNFGGSDYITRAEFAAMAVRFFDVEYDGPDIFLDCADHWARHYINKAGSAGLVYGYEDGTFRPQNYISRAEAMTIMNRVLGRAPNKDHLLDGMIEWADNMDAEKWYYANVQEATNSHEYDLHNDFGTTPVYETWKKLSPIRDWAALEREWAAQNDTSSPGEVISSSTATK